MNARLTSFNHRWSRNRMRWRCWQRFVCSAAVARVRTENPAFYQRFYGEIEEG